MIPYEGANEGRKVYYENAMSAALNAVKKKKWREALKYSEMSKQWPENLGVGRPYSVDERLPDFLLGYIHEKMGAKQVSDKYYEKVIDFNDENSSSPVLLAQLLAAERTKNQDKLQLLIDKNLTNENENIHWAMTKFRNKSTALKGPAVDNFDKSFLTELMSLINP